jgi:Spy/CpxP family protein refolding chaperone
VLFGQDPGGMMPAGEAQAKVLEAMKERLKLTADQEQKIKAIFEDHEKQMVPLREKLRSGGDRAASRSEIRELRQSTDAKVAEVLTAEQKPEYQKMQQEMRDKMRDRIQEGGRRRGPER